MAAGSTIPSTMEMLYLIAPGVLSSAPAFAAKPRGCDSGQAIK
jgi:hypothetical protein